MSSLLYFCLLLFAEPKAPAGGAKNETSAAKDQEPDQRFRLDRSEIDSEEWQAAIRKAKAHQSGRGSYSLMRVIIEDADDSEPIQLQGTKLKEFTEEYHGGGGAFQTAVSGEFVLLEHINSNRRKDNRDPLLIGTLSHSRSRVWIDVPKMGELGVVGDIVVRKCPEDEMGVLNLKLNQEQGAPAARLMIAPVVVGGQYGKTYQFEKLREFEVRLPPGDYKILLPDIDSKKHRWDVTISPKQRTKLVFDEDVRLESQDTEPIENQP